MRNKLMEKYIVVSIVYNENLLTGNYGRKSFNLLSYIGHIEYDNRPKVTQDREYATKYQKYDRLRATPLARSGVKEIQSI